MGNIWNCLTLTIASLAVLAPLAPTTKADTDPLVCIVANDVLLNALQLELDLYSEDLAREGLRTKVVTFNEGNCTDLKALIANEFSNDLVGCLFIGDLPVAYFEDRLIDNETYPCDLYFEDLDGTWIDADNNGKFENHTSGVSGNRNPEIWVGRLKVPVPYVGPALDEVSLLKKYFGRNHAYRTGSLTLPDRALLYIEDDWYNEHNTLDSAVSVAFTNRTVVYDMATTNPQDYLNRLTQGWSLVHLKAHGGGESHAFYNNGTYLGSVNRLDIRAIDPQVFFYTLESCVCTDFDFFTDYIAGSYVFCSNSSLALLGMTDSGLLCDLDVYYRSFSTETLGSSLIQTFENWISQEDSGSWYNFAYYYGATIIGDPTLHLNVEVAPPTIYDIAIVALNTSMNTLFPEDTVTIALKVKNNGNTRNEDFDVTIYWGEYLIETRQVLGLAPASAETLNISWTVPRDFNGTHRVCANATLVEDDAKPEDNTLEGTMLTVIQKIHDVAVTSINPRRTVLSNWIVTSIDVTVTNQGNTAETANVTLSHNSSVVATQTIALNHNSSATLTFSWNTMDLRIGNYTLNAQVSQAPNETDTADNSMILIIQVSILADINGDGRVDMKDVSKAAAGFQTHSGDTKWAANGDLDENGVIDMKDISTIAKHFGEHYP